MAPTEGQLKESEALKLQGNTAFGKKEFSAAHNFYTAAISLNPSSPALYSNRAAALISMRQLLLALNDSNMAIKLDPKWAKAYRRKAAVLEEQGDYIHAKAAYEKSLEVALEAAGGDPKQRKQATDDVLKLIGEIEKKLSIYHPYRSSIISVDDAPGPRIMKEFDRRCAAGEPMGSWPPNGSCLRRIWVAEMQFQNALANLSQFTEGQVPGAPSGVMGIFGRVQTLEELTTALIEDIRVIRINQHALDKLKLCYRLEQQRRNAIGPGLSAKETIAAYNTRLTQPPQANHASHSPDPGHNSTPSTTAQTGWDLVRPALQLSIRSSIMNGSLFALDLANGNDEYEFRRAVDLIEEAHKAWPNVDGSIRGRTLEETFLRGVKVFLGEALIRGYNNVKRQSPPGAQLPNSQRQRLEEIKAIGEWLISSFLSNPKPPDNRNASATAANNRPRDDADPWWNIYYAHYVAPHSRGYAFVGFYYTQLAIDFLPPDSESRSASLIAGARAYATSAGWMSPDDPERINRAFNAIFALVKSSSGYYKSDIGAILSMAEAAKEWYSPYFAPQISVPYNHVGELEGLGALSKDQPPLKGDVLSLTRIMCEEWKVREKRFGEVEWAVGGSKILGSIDNEVKGALHRDGLGWAG